MENNINRLPDNFSSLVMAELDRRIEERERKEGIYRAIFVTMASITIVVAAVIAINIFYPQIGMSIKNYYFQFINNINNAPINSELAGYFKDRIGETISFFSKNITIIICLIDLGILYLLSGKLSRYFYLSSSSRKARTE